MRFRRRRRVAHFQAPVQFAEQPIDPARWEWADEVSDATVRRMAEVALPLFEESNRWIHRRVERIRFLDYDTIHRQVSVDFTLPTGVTPVGRFEDRDVLIAPLLLLRKDHPRPLRVGKERHWWAPKRPKHRKRLPMSLYSDVDFTDQNKKHIPLLTHDQSNQLANAMLQQAAAKTLKKPVSKDHRNELTAIAFADRRRRRRALNNLLLKEPDRGSDSPLTLLGNSPFAELACMLVTHSPVICLFTDGPLDRSIVKFSCIESMDEERASAKGRIRRSIGWKSEYLSIGIPEIGASASHHIEIEIPDELQVNSVSLTGKRYISANKRWRDLTTEEKDYSVRQIGTARSGNIYMSELPYARRMGRAVIKMRSRRPGFLFGALTVSAIITAVLAVLALITPEIITNLQSNSEGAIAALLLFPSVVAAYIARPGEHVITSRMLRWARFVLVGNAALPFFAVLFLLTTPESPLNAGLNLGGLVNGSLSIVAPQDSPVHGLEARWALLAVISGLLTCMFAISNIWPRPHGASYYRLMSNQPDNQTVIG